VAVASTHTVAVYVLAELIGAHQAVFESRSQPPLEELAVWARAHDPECTTACERASEEPQESAGTPADSKPGLGSKFDPGGGGGGGGALW
jgi:hypothetical protein